MSETRPEVIEAAAVGDSDANPLHHLQVLTLKQSYTFIVML